jgi:hypothetical protein
MQAERRDRLRSRLCTVIPAKAGDAMRPKSALAARLRRQCAPHRIGGEALNDAACRRRGAACGGEL